jgi:glucose-6-phosphate 1-epimerase
MDLPDGGSPAFNADASGNRVDPIRFHGLPAYRLQGPQGAVAIVTQQGAQLLSWNPAGGQEWLYLSEASDFSGNTPIRGGVPICFPQFSNQGHLPKHGLVRGLPWQWIGQDASADQVSITLGLSDSADSRLRWPHAFSLRLTLRLAASSLSIVFDVENTGTEAVSFTSALHTYLRVDEIGAVRIDGLGEIAYRDAANGNVERVQAGEALVIDGELDRVYHAAPDAIILREPQRALRINSTGFAETVVWNPGPEKCAALADMPAGGYAQMVCIEAACADINIALAPGAKWQGEQSFCEISPGDELR